LRTPPASGPSRRDAGRVWQNPFLKKVLTQTMERHWSR
jgi:hypothetical protein